MELFLSILLKIGLGVIVSLIVPPISKGAKTVGSRLLLFIRKRNNSPKKVEDLHKTE